MNARKMNLIVDRSKYYLSIFFVGLFILIATLFFFTAGVNDRPVLGLDWTVRPSMRLIFICLLSGIGFIRFKKERSSIAFYTIFLLVLGSFILAILEG